MDVIDKPVVNKRPQVVEIIGPAGAGKSTLAQTLCERNRDIVVEIPLPKAGRLPIVIGDMLLFLPTYLHHYRRGRWFTWRETRFMAYVQAWQRHLSKHVFDGKAAIVFDHGPLFRLASLLAFGPEIIESQVYERWMDSKLDSWATILDLVVWLDAPSGTLTKRIDMRTSDHRIKVKAEEEAFAFLARYRMAFDQVVSRLLSKGSPKLLRFDTGRETTDHVADQVLAAIKSTSD